MNHGGLQSVLSDIAAALPSVFAAHGIRLSVEPMSEPAHPEPDLWCNLLLDEHQIRVAVEVRTRWSQLVLDQLAAIQRGAHDAPLLLAMPRISPHLRALLREKQINHVDLAGTLYLHAPGIRIDVQQRVASSLIHRPTRQQLVNPFSKRASMVLRVLFEHPTERLRFTELAARTGLAAGWASGVADEIVNRGYAEKSAQGIRLADPASALRDWLVAYTWTKNDRVSYVVPYAPDELPRRLGMFFKKPKVEWALTLLSAAQRLVGYVRAEGPVHVYVRAEEGVVRDALKKLFAEPSVGEGQVSILTPYYGKAAFFGAQQMNSTPVVSDLQLFLDLARFPVRGPEAAEALLRTRLAPSLQMRAGDLHRVLADLA
jgi:hypothetical protein